uniref:Uncharacterized protein n=1 Tax=Chlamydomonas leiostraca TaxID=1034604 RepID=A0A7S0REI2_9CHLO
MHTTEATAATAATAATGAAHHTTSTFASAQRASARDAAAAALARASAAARAAANVGATCSGSAHKSSSPPYQSVFVNSLYSPTTAAASRAGRSAERYSGKWWMEESDGDSASDSEVDVHRSYQDYAAMGAVASASASARARSTSPHRSHAAKAGGSNGSQARRGLAFDIPITPPNPAGTSHQATKASVAAGRAVVQQQQAAAAGVRQVHTMTGAIQRAAASKWQLRQQQEARTQELLQRAGGTRPEPRVQVTRELRQLVGLAAGTASEAAAASSSVARARAAGAAHATTTITSSSHYASHEVGATWAEAAHQQQQQQHDDAGRAAGRTGQQGTFGEGIQSLVHALGGHVAGSSKPAAATATGSSASARAAAAAAAASEARRVALDRLKLLRSSTGSGAAGGVVGGSHWAGGEHAGSDHAQVEREDARVRAMARMADTVYSMGRQ